MQLCWILSLKLEFLTEKYVQIGMRKYAVLCVSVSENSQKTIAVNNTLSSCLTAWISVALLHKSLAWVSHTLKKRKLHRAENLWYYGGLYSTFWVHKKAVGNNIWEHRE